MTQIRYFTHGLTLAYRTYGDGPVPVLAFHGFGRTGADFHILEGTIGERCTIYAFDLHFHGESPSYPHRADQPFTPKELALFFAAFADELNVVKVTLLGYSLGGRMALNLLEQIPERVDQAFLVAPDGLKTRPWYRGMAASRAGRWVYTRFVEHPERIHFLIHGLRRLRLMNERMHRFLIGQSDSRAKRMLLRDVWLSYRMIEPALDQVARNAREHRFFIHLFFGTFDRVIKPHFGDRLRHHAPEQITHHELPFGHVLLTRELGEAMKVILASRTAPIMR